MRAFEVLRHQIVLSEMEPEVSKREFADSSHPLGKATVLTTLLATLAGTGSLLLYSTYLGARWAFAPTTRSAPSVEEPTPALVDVLASAAEGPAGILLLSVATAGAIAASFFVLLPDGEEHSTTGIRAPLNRAWDDLNRLAADVARWAATLPARRSRWHLVGLVTVVVGGLVLRLLYIEQPVRYDEAFTFNEYASRPLAEALSDYSYPNNHLFHTFLVHMVVDLVGSSGPAVLRMPAFLVGVAVVPATYGAWNAINEPNESLVAAALVAVSSPLILFSTNARGYSLIVLFFLLLVPLANRLRRSRNIGAWSLFWAVSTLALYTIPVALYPIGGVLAWLVISGRSATEDGATSTGALDDPRAARPREQLLRETGVALLAIGLATAWLYAPSVQSRGLAAVIANRFVVAAPVGEFLTGLPDFAADVWTQWTRGIPDPVAALLAICGVAGVIREVYTTSRSDDGFSLPLVLLGWSMLLLLLKRRVPFARTWLFLLPVSGLLVARGIRWGGELILRRAKRQPMPRTGPAVTLVLLLGIGGSVVAAESVQKSLATWPFQDGEKMARRLKTDMEPGDTVIAAGAAPVLRYWFTQLGLSRQQVQRAGTFPADGRLFAVVHDAGGQTLEDLVSRISVEEGFRIKAERVVRFEHSTAYALFTVPTEE